MKAVRPSIGDSVAHKSKPYLVMVVDWVGKNKICCKWIDEQQNAREAWFDYRTLIIRT